MKAHPHEESYYSQLRLLLEELLCDLVRLRHAKADGAAPEAVAVDREIQLGPNSFADIRVTPPGQAAYLIEVKYGYTPAALVGAFKRKFGADAKGLDGIGRVVLLTDADRKTGWEKTREDLRAVTRAGLEIEIWSEAQLLGMMHEHLGVQFEGISNDNLLDVQHQIEHARGFLAFGGKSLAEYEHDALNAELIWRFGVWRLRELAAAGNFAPRTVMPPGLYRDVVILLADMCSFSSYVRDTRDDEVIRHSLTTFYSKARYEIINHGGMLYQFVGDEVVGLFGVPAHSSATVQQAIEAARGLRSIGLSVSSHWQRKIDRLQASKGLHLGASIGDLQVVSLRPFSRTHMGVVGDPINMAARLMSTAGPSEIVISNALHSQLEEAEQASFDEVEPVEAKNVGRIKAWKARAPVG